MADEHVEVVIESYGCICGFTLDVEQDPQYPKVDPLTQAFYDAKGWTQRGMAVGDCLNCHVHGRKGELGRIIDPDRQCVMQIKTPESLESAVTEVKNEDGSVVMEQTGVTERKYIEGDEIKTEEVPVLTPVTRELTEEEKQLELAKIDDAMLRAEMMQA